MPIVARRNFPEGNCPGAIVLSRSWLSGAIVHDAIILRGTCSVFDLETISQGELS